VVEGCRMENVLNDSYSIATMTETVPENCRAGDPRWQHPAVARRRHGGDVIPYLADLCRVLGKIRCYGSC